MSFAMFLSLVRAVLDLGQGQASSPVPGAGWGRPWCQLALRPLLFLFRAKRRGLGVGCALGDRARWGLSGVLGQAWWNQGGRVGCREEAAWGPS